MNFVLVSLLHDPDERMMSKIQERMPILKSLYTQICLIVSDETNPVVIEELHEQGAMIQISGDMNIGRKRREALELGLQNGAERIHYCDFDRMLHWIGSYPKELEDVLSEFLENDFTIIGRTPRAFRTHPRVQQDTERITNHVCSIALDRTVDVTAGSCALAGETARLILEHSNALSVATDTEWPMIVKLFSDYSIGYLEVEGLEFETVEYYQDEIAVIGSREKWIEEVYDSSIDMWFRRMQFSIGSIEALLSLDEARSNRH